LCNSRALLFILLVLQVLPAVAEWTDQELSVLPPYCAARLRHTPGEYEHWNNALGPDFLHTHHYCDALASINRYYAARSAQDKAFNLTNALGGLNYMVSHASQSYSLMPEIYLNRGVVLTLMKKDGDALKDLLKALELDPKLIRGYAMASDFYTKIKRRDEALKVVTEGLRNNPGNARLQRLYQELGGKLPYPEPIAPEPEKSLQPLPTPAAPAPATLQAPALDDKPPAQAEPSTPADAGPPAKAKIGTPSNPWCRFCPEPAQ
jgi:tetratricopeptide (TPR) repeat protein